MLSSPEIHPKKLNFTASKPEPSRKLSLETGFLVLMKRRLNLLQTDVAYIFDVSPGKVSQLFITWTKLLSKQLGVLVIWPSKSQVRKTLPQCFKKLYPKVYTIIDCTEIYAGTPNSLDSRSLLLSEYKHHTTIKILVFTTSNGAFFLVSPAYGARPSDVFIVRDFCFFDLLEPYNQTMVDKGFKIKPDRALKQCPLAIPPSVK